MKLMHRVTDGFHPPVVVFYLMLAAVASLLAVAR